MENLKKKKKKKKRRLLIILATVINKDLKTSIRKHANELRVYEKTVRASTKQDLIPNFNSLDYAIWGILENKTKKNKKNSHPNISSLKSANELE